MKCPNCEQEILVNVKYCPYCGTPNPEYKSDDTGEVEKEETDDSVHLQDIIDVSEDDTE